MECDVSVYSARTADHGGGPVLRGVWQCDGDVVAWSDHVINE